MQTSSGRGNRILLFRTAAAAASLLLALLAAEIGVRIFAPYESPLASPPAGRINPYGENPWLAKAAPWGHFHKPYALYHPATEEYETTYRIGSRGFRIPETRELRAPAGQTLAIVGDSITEGHGVDYEQTFSGLLGARLRGRWDVLNHGTQGAGPFHHALNLPRHLAPEPDALVVVLFDNDLRDDWSLEKDFADLPWIPEAEDLVTGLNSPPGQPVSHLFARLRSVLRRPDETVLLPAFREQFAARAAAGHIPGPNDPGGPFCVPRDEWPDVQERTTAWLDYLADETERQGVPLLVVHAGLMYLTIGEECTAQSDFFDVFAEEWATRRGIPYLSLRAELLAGHNNPETPDMLLPEDGHYSPAGHAFIADRLEAWLREMGIILPAPSG